MPVIKSMSRKGNPNFKKIVDYILKKQDRPAWLVLHNMDVNPSDKEGILEAFKTNDEFRKVRKNGACYYHEILSFSDLDKEVLLQNPWIMEDLTREYLNLRTNGIALGYPHLDQTNALHVHMLLSANELESSKSIRISKSQFRKIKRIIEEIQIERYPEVKNSRIECSYNRIIQEFG